MSRARWSIPLLAALGLALVAPACGAVAGATSAPYTDPNAVGYIGLCNKAGHQITSGNVNTSPFVWRAVSSEPARPPYNNSYRTAILLAYQPQQGLASGEWTGAELSASSRYTNPAHPMAEMTPGDGSLEDFTSDYHPNWDGFVQLRIYLGTADEEAYSLQYPALNIQVTGDTWHVVGGRSVNCDTGSAESIESILLPKMTTTTTSAAASQVGPSGGTAAAASSHSTGDPSTAGTTTATSSAGSGDPIVAAGTTTAPGSRQRSASAVLADAAHSSADPWIGLAVIAALLVLVGSGVLVARRRRPALVRSISETSRDSHKKG
jgi:hypothetical protein